MFCSKCGAENADTAKFCKSCGAPIVFQQPQYQQPQYQPPLQNEKPKKKKKKGCLITFLIALGILVVLFVAAALNGGEISVSTANIKDAVMASQIDPNTKEAVVATDVFPQASPVIYVTAYIANVPGDTKVSAIWTYVPSGETLEGDPVIVNQDAQIQFNVEMPNGFMPGEYKVDLLLDDEIKETLNFTVE